MADIQDLELFEQKQFVPLSTTIGDYPQSNIDGAIASSPVSTVAQNVSGTEFNLFSGSVIRLSQIFNAGAAEIGNLLQEVSFWLSKTGAPTGTVTFLVRDSGDSIVHTFGTLTAASLTGTETKITKNTGEYILKAGDRVCVEFSGGGSSDKVIVHARDTNGYDGTDSHVSHYIAAWVEITDHDTRFEMKFIRASDLIDGNTGTVWTSGSETNPQVVLDLASLQEITAITLYRHSSDTTTQITIEVSPNDSVYTLVRTINTSLIIVGQYSYALFNRPLELMRYVRIRGTDGSAKVMSYAEIAVRVETESLVNRQHKHLNISANQATLPLNGDTS